MTDGSEVKLRRWKLSFVSSGVFVSRNPPMLRLEKLIFVVAAVKSITSRACACLGQYLEGQACKGVPSVPQQVMTDDAQWELRWGRVLFLSVYALRAFLQRCTWTATAQLRKDEDRRDKPGKIKKADL